tara:strand:- start:347 stop:1036 length:690 start_codon:yes stop_codon:yes gene_type:complete
MSKLIIANFKMNGTKSSIKQWFNDFSKENNTSNEVIVALPSTFLIDFVDNDISLAAQNVSSYTSGAYTSQISAEMLKDCGINYSIIGHSESREFLKETDEDIFKKYLQLKKYHLASIICIGESLKNREDNLFKSFLSSQLKQFEDEEDELIIAYEPIWAIGSGLIPTIEDINEVSELIREICKNVKILYGGSVNKENASNLLNNSNIDGVLVGGASLDPKEFANIAQSC